MTTCKTGAEHIKSLKDGRTVYIDGKLVDDVTVHPAFRNSVKSAADALRLPGQAGKHRADDVRAARFEPPRQPLLADAAQLRRRWWQRRKAMQAWAAQSYGFMGRSPDHLASALVGQCMGIEVFEKHGAARAKALRDYFEEASRNDYFLTYVIINPQAERGKDWGEQKEDLVARIVDEDPGGLTIRGAKMLGTSSIMANEVFVANLQPLKAGEEDLAFSCALPMNARGLRVLSRKSYEAAAVSVFDNPLSSRFDENDALHLFRGRQGAVGARLRAPRPGYVPRPVPRHRGAHLPELPVADPPVGEDEVPHRPRASPHRGDRHHRHAGDPRAARQVGRASEHGQRHDGRHGGGRLDARRMVRAQQALHVFGAGADAGSLPAHRQYAARSLRRRADHAAVVDPRFRGSAR